MLVAKLYKNYKIAKKLIISELIECKRRFKICKIQMKIHNSNYSNTTV